MAKKKNEIAIATESTDLAVPEWLQEVDETGLETASQFIQPARIKLIQTQTKAPLKGKFQPGDAVLMPQEMLLSAMSYEGATASTSEPFTFVPLFFFPEWLSCNKYGVDPFIIERTIDPNSPIARKAKSAQHRKEGDIRHVEVLNFLIKLDHEMYGELPVVLSFSKGGWRTGSNFLTLMKMRRGPIWSMRFQGSVSLKSNSNDDEFYGFDIGNPDEGNSPFIAEGEMAHYKAAYDDLKAAHDSNRIVVDHDEESDEVVVESSEY